MVYLFSLYFVLKYNDPKTGMRVGDFQGHCLLAMLNINKINFSDSSITTVLTVWISHLKYNERH